MCLGETGSGGDPGGGGGDGDGEVGDGGGGGRGPRAVLDDHECRSTHYRGSMKGGASTVCSMENDIA